MTIFSAPFSPAYSASKGGIVQFARSCATAWAKDNIQVNSILPGWIDTELTVKAREQVQGLNERVLARTPAGRWGAPDDFAGIAVFLASPASDFLTGTAIPVDGGYSIADIALYAYTQSAEAVGYKVAPSVKAWLKRVAEQPGYVRIKKDPTGKCPL